MDSIGNYSEISFRRKGTGGTAIGVNQEIGLFSAYGWDGTTYGPSGSNVSINFIANENFTTTARGTHINFWVTATGADTSDIGLQLYSDKLIPGTNNALTLGSTTKMWSDLFLGDGGVINWNNGNATLTHSTGLLTSNVPLALGTNSLTLTGSIGATGARATKVWATDIESTNMPTVGGTAILSSLTAPQFTTIELGHATDTTLSRVSAGVVAVEGVTIPTISSTNTLTNKRITKRVASTASDTTAVIDSDSYDEYYLTAMAGATEISVTGTPTTGQTIFIGLKDDGTTRALTWTGITALGVTLPTTTTVSKQHIIGIKYIASAWRAIAVSEEA